MLNNKKIELFKLTKIYLFRKVIELAIYKTTTVINIIMIKINMNLTFFHIFIFVTKFLLFFIC